MCDLWWSGRLLQEVPAVSIRRTIRNVNCRQKQRARCNLMDTFKKFMEHCALQTGRILNCSKLARALGVSPPLVRRWVEILIRDHLAHLLPAYPEGYGRRQLTTAKLYFWDTGVMRAAMKNSNRFDHASEALLQETWLVAEIRKTLIHEAIRGGVYYWQDRRGLMCQSSFTPVRVGWPSRCARGAGRENLPL